MNVHPLIADTVGLWQLDGNLLDSSGNNLNLATCLGNSAGVVFGGVEQYGPFPAVGGQGFKFDATTPTKLVAPLSPLYRLSGDMTIEFLMLQLSTVVQCHVICANPAGRSGGGNVSDRGSLYSYLFTVNNIAGYFNTNIGNNIPSPSYGFFVGAGAPGPPNNWGTGNVHHYAYRRSGAQLDCFVDGVKYTGCVDITPNTVLGNERLYIGGFEGVGLCMTANGIIGTMRMLDVARPDADIARDAFYTLGEAVPTGADAGIVYDAVAAAQFATSLGLEPRS